MSETKEFRVFYSWQSDLPSKANLNAIRKALKDACKKLSKNHPDTSFIADEATRDTAGSPNIAQTILEKIQKADAFVSDITTITPNDFSRACPNPNVTYELGYAVGQLGWDRVVLLFNKSFGNFPKDLPFDLSQQRVSSYNVPEEGDRNGQNDLVRLLEVAIGGVFEKNPKTPIELRGVSIDKIQHERDVENMNWLMSTLHIPSLDLHVEDLPRCIYERIFHFWEEFKSVASNSLFALYDERLENLVSSLFQSWQVTLSFGHQYRLVPGKHSYDARYIFSNPMDAALNEEQQKDWDEVERARVEMYDALQNLLAHLRKNYVEIDVSSTNRKAWGGYQNLIKDVE